MEVVSLPVGTIAFLFTDIEGSTRLAAQVGAAFSGLMDDHFRILDRLVAASGGTSVSSEGDALFAVFPSVRQAVEAAVAAQRELAEHAWPEGAALRVRMGIHAGEAVLGGRNYAGVEVHRAARVMAAGWGGQILLSDAAQSLIGSEGLTGVSLRDLGSFRLRDLARAERLFQVVAAGLSEDFPPLRSEAAETPTNLPAPLTRLVGRRREVAEIGALLLTERLVTLTGAGGTGKTRLAIEAARSVVDRYPDGVWFVALDVVRDRSLVISTISTTLGLPEVPGRPTADVVAAHLAARRTLLVLDNLEQVIEAAPDIAALLAAAPALRIIASSREPLQIAAERSFPVLPLTLPAEPGIPRAADIADEEAVALFVERAAAARPDFQLTDGNAPAVAAICRRLDGLPLAIELAAARSNVLAPEQILERLDHRLTLLAGARRDLPDRQRSLRGAIDWSHDLLDGPQRALFRRFGAFAGGAELTAVETVVDPDRTLGVDMLDLCGSLVDRSLLRSRQDVDGSRVEMLETVRVYAEERLAESGEDEATRDRHLEHFADLAAQSRNLLSEQQPEARLQVLERELPNFRAAVAWSFASGQLEEGLTLLTDLADFWHMRGHVTEARRSLQQFLEATMGQGTTSARARAESTLGELAGWQGDYARGYQHSVAALAMAEELGDDVLAGVSHVSLGWLSLEARPEEARQHFASALRALGDSGHEPSRDGALQGYPLALIRVGRVEEAEREAKRAIEDADARGNRYINAFNFLTLGALALDRGDDREAIRCAAEALTRSNSAGGHAGLALALDLVADVLVSRGDLVMAARLTSAAARLRAEMGGGPEISLAGRELVLPRLEAAMDAQTFRQATDEGRAMGIENAVAAAIALAKAAP